MNNALFHRLSFPCLVMGVMLCGPLAEGDPAKVSVLDGRVLRWLPSSGLVGGSSFDGEMRAFGEQSVEGRIGRGFRIGNGEGYALRDRADNPVGDWDRDQAFSVSVWFKADENSGGEQVLVSRMDSRKGSRGWSIDVYPRAGYLAMELMHHWPDNVIKVMTPTGSTGRGQWHQVVMTYDGSSTAKGVSLYIDGRAQVLRVDKESLTKTMKHASDTMVGCRAQGAYKARQVAIDEVRIYDRVLEEVERRRLALLVPGRPVGRAATVRVSLVGKSILSLAEVEVFVGGFNVAATGQTIQSSSYGGGVASRANDGNTDGRFDYGSVTHTLQAATDPWWKVDLAFPAAVEQVVLWNRWGDGGRLEHRLNNAKVEVLDVKGGVLWEGTVPAPAPQRILFDVGLVELEGLELK